MPKTMTAPDPAAPPPLPRSKPAVCVLRRYAGEPAVRVLLERANGAAITARCVGVMHEPDAMAWAGALNAAGVEIISETIPGPGDGPEAVRQRKAVASQ